MLKAGVSNLKEDSQKPGIGSPRWRASGKQRESTVLDTTMRVTTPENISFQYQLAGPFRRIFAYFFDIVISLGAYAALCVAIYMVFLFLAFLLSLLFNGAGPVIMAIFDMIQGFQGIGWFIVYWFYGAYMETRFNGQTLGKRITKMRVITTNGHAIDGVQATLRNFFRFLDLMPLISISNLLAIEQTGTEFDQILNAPLIPTCLFGLIVMTLSKRYQRVGDLVADTVVVNEEQKYQPNLATFMDERVPMLAELIPTSFVVPASMARAIADYVDQRKYLPFQRASEIASHLATPLMEKFGIAPDTDDDLFLCALYHKTFVTVNVDEDDFAPLPGAKHIVNSADPAAPTKPVGTGNEFELDPSDFRINTQ